MDMVRVSSLTVINHLECKGQAEGQGQSPESFIFHPEGGARRVN